MAKKRYAAKEVPVSDDSPLFVSAIELIAHSTELYTQGNERKYKFIILHLANAIELILKDRLVDKGISIYIPRKSLTITIWDSFEKLEAEGTSVPERPIIELLVDDRNTIQHRFSFPDSETVYFYLKRVIAFFKRFLDEEYGVDLADALKPYLSTEDLVLLGLVEEEDEYGQLDKLFKLYFCSFSQFFPWATPKNILYLFSFTLTNINFFPNFKSFSSSRNNL